MCIQGGAPEMIKIGTAFQDCLQLLVGVETMNNRKKHETSLNDTESKEQGYIMGHRKGGEKRYHKNHGVKKMEMLAVNTKFTQCRKGYTIEQVDEYEYLSQNMNLNQPL